VPSTGGRQGSGGSLGLQAAPASRLLRGEVHDGLGRYPAAGEPQAHRRRLPILLHFTVVEARTAFFAMNPLGVPRRSLFSPRDSVNESYSDGTDEST
jgi:hypothetical protein